MEPQSCPFCQQILDTAALAAGDCPACKKSLAITESTYLMPADFPDYWPESADDKATGDGDPDSQSPDTRPPAHALLPRRTLSLSTDPSAGLHDYELIKELGHGGMGIIYEARQGSIDRTIAVKRLKPEIAGDRRVRDKFIAEARIAGDLDHPNIVPVYELGQDETGGLFYAMKQVQGVPWKSVMRQKSLAENLEILLRVADAVAFAHSRGVIHRDLKAENVMLGEFGEVLLMDWGLAMAIHGIAKAKHGAQTVVSGGTPAYMPPEMATKDTTKIGVGCDVYLLGTILFEILTGKAPHPGRDAVERLQAAADNTIVEVAGLPDQEQRLMAIARTAMSTEIEQRHHSVKEFQDAVRQFQSHAESVARTARAEADLERAQATGQYDDFVQALFGFQEARSLWPANDVSGQGESRARVAYATRAFQNGDFDLARSLLSRENVDHRVLVDDIERGRLKRQRQQRRHRRLVMVARGLAATIIVTLTIAFLWVNRERSKAEAARIAADELRVAEANHRQQAEREKERAIVAEQAAVREKELAITAQRREADQRRIATAERQRADDETARAATAQEQEIAQRHKAEVAEIAVQEAQAVVTQQTLQAQLAEARAQESLRQQAAMQYVSRLFRIENRIRESAFLDATRLLLECPPESRHWEWGRLSSLCRPRSLALRDAGHHMTCAAFLQDGRRLVTGGADGSLRLWDADNGTVLLQVANCGGEPVGIACQAGDHIVVCLRDGAIKSWQPTADGALTSIKGPYRETRMTVMASLGQLGLSCLADGAVEIWRLPLGMVVTRFNRPLPQLSCAGVFAGNQRYVTGETDGTVRFWQTVNSLNAWEITTHLSTVVEDESAEAEKPSEPARDVESSHTHDLVVIEEMVARQTSSGGIHSLAISPDQKSVVIGGTNGAATAMNVADGTERFVFSGHSGAVHAVAYSADGQWLATGSDDRSTRIWHARTGAELMALPPSPAAIRIVVFSSMNWRLLTIDRDHEARLWDLRGGEPVVAFNGHRRPVVALLWIPDGQRVVSTDDAGVVVVWNAATGAEESRWQHPDAKIVGMWLADDQNTVLIRDDRMSVTLFDPRRGERIGTVSPQYDFAGDMATLEPVDRLIHRQRERLLAIWKGHATRARILSPDGRRELSGIGSKEITVMDPVSSTMQLTLRGHASRITAAGFSPDGKRILTASSDTTAKLWSVDTGLELLTLKGHSEPITALAFSDDGTHILTGGQDGACVVWSADDWRAQR